MKHSFIKAAALGLTALLFADPAAAETKIVYANYLGMKHPTNAALERFFKRVEEDTKGSVKWEGHFASSLLGAKDIPAGVRDGIADAGYFVSVYVPSEMPVDNYFGDFSMINDDAVVMTGVSNELVLLKCPECDAEYRNGFKTMFLGTYALTDYLFQCKEEVKTLADFKGKKIRGFSGWTELIKAMGAVPVNVSANEMYEALQRGTIDCATHSITSQKTRSLGEVAKYVVMDSLGGYMGGATINLRLDKWNALKESERTAILKNVPKLVAEGLYAYVKLDVEVKEEMEKKGNKFYNASPEVGKLIKEFRADYVKTKSPLKGKERGVKNPEKIAETIYALHKKWDGLIAKHGRDQATFEKLLWDEIYSKVSVK